MGLKNESCAFRSQRKERTPQGPVRRHLAEFLDDRGCVVDGGGVAKQKGKPKTALPKGGRNLKGMGHAKRGLTGTGRRRGLVEEPRNIVRLVTGRWQTQKRRLISLYSVGTRDFSPTS